MKHRGAPIMAAILILASVFGASCATIPKNERLAAEKAYKQAVFAKRCKTDKYLAATRLLNEAREDVNKKKYDEAKIAFVTAEKLFKEAEAEAKADPKCNPNLKPNESSKQDKPILERDIQTQDASAETAPDPLDDPNYKLEMIHFPFDSDAITDEAREILDRNARWLEKHPEYGVIVEGHCDNRGSVEYNLALGARRAEAVKKYLVQLGIAPDRIQTISYGEERPIDDSNDPEAWAKNRRAEFKKVKKGK